jgi:hypothetical protein
LQFWMIFCTTPATRRVSESGPLWTTPTNAPPPETAPHF